MTAKKHKNGIVYAFEYCTFRLLARLQRIMANLALESLRIVFQVKFTVNSKDLVFVGTLSLCATE